MKVYEKQNYRMITEGSLYFRRLHNGQNWEESIVLLFKQPDSWRFDKYELLHESTPENPMFTKRHSTDLDRFGSDSYASYIYGDDAKKLMEEYIEPTITIDESQKVVAWAVNGTIYTDLDSANDAAEEFVEPFRLDAVQVEIKALHLQPNNANKLSKLVQRSIDLVENLCFD